MIKSRDKVIRRKKTYPPENGKGNWAGPGGSEMPMAVAFAVVLELAEIALRHDGQTKQRLEAIKMIRGLGIGSFNLKDVVRMRNE